MRPTMTFAARPAHAVTGALAATLALAAAADGVSRMATAPASTVTELLRVVVAMVAIVLVVFHVATLVRARRHPVLRITERMIEYSPPDALRTRRLRGEEMEGVAWHGRDAIGVRLTTGEVVDLYLFTLPRSRRSQATTAVRAFVARHTSADGG